jgi:hypothetical protein|tara:strand:+ start:220 stop:420 length:201 start_codon:yes stop_codon:yes gene_type:complete
MGNMSYCRFENTARDLEDCLDAIMDYEFDEMSDREADGLQQLLFLAQQITEYESRIEDAIHNHYED